MFAYFETARKSVCIMTNHEARALLIKNGYKINKNHEYQFLMVEDGDYKTVEQLLRNAGYDGFFCVKRKLRKRG